MYLRPRSFKVFSKAGLTLCASWSSFLWTALHCQSFDIVGGQLPDPICSEDLIPKLGSNEQLLPLDDTLIEDFGESLPN